MNNSSWRPFRIVTPGILWWFLLVTLIAGCGGPTPEVHLLSVAELPKHEATLRQPRLARFAPPPLILDQSPESRSLRASIDALFSDNRFDSSTLAASVAYLGKDNHGSQDALLYERGIHRLLTPASNMKLFTTAAALETLAPEFHYKTKVEMTGTLAGGVLHGDLIVHGSGDPTISARQHNWDPFAVFRTWARIIKDSGINTIQGDLVGDASLFSKFSFPLGWDPSDLSIWYAAQTDALSYNENCVKLFVRVGKQGSPVSVTMEPSNNVVQIHNSAMTVGRRSANSLDISRIPLSNTIVVKGNLPRRYPERVRTVTVDDPATLFMDVLASVLRENGVTVQGRVRVERKPGMLQKGKILHTHISLSLPQIIEFTNKESNNLFAEQLLLTTKAAIDGYAERESATGYVEKWIQSMGVPKEEFDMRDGSGLSRNNRISANAVLTLLRYMHRSPNARTFRTTLPIAGVDGTLRRRMRGTPAYTKVRAKTGFMKGVSSLSGYVDTAGGETLAFTLLYNGHSPSTSYVKTLEHELCSLLAQYAGHPARH